jgi:hypothetical protein
LLPVTVELLFLNSVHKAKNGTGDGTCEFVVAFCIESRFNLAWFQFAGLFARAGHSETPTGIAS